MRISIWQQWASNHSASFTVVGVFETVEAANHGVAEVRRLLASIVEYSAQHPEIEKAFLEERQSPSISPPEQAFAQEYDIDLSEWTWTGTGIDWLFGSPDTTIADVSAFAVDRMVFVLNAGDTHIGERPFDLLLAKLGGRVVVSQEYEGVILLNLSCKAPDESIAIRLEECFIACFTNKKYDALTEICDCPLLYRGKVSRDKVELILHQVEFLWNAWKELPQLLGGLTSLGCTDIEWDLEQGER